MVSMCVLIFLFVGDDSFCGEEPGWLAKLCVGWEPACFYPCVQQVDRRVFADYSYHLHCLCLLLIWEAQSSVLVLVRQSLSMVFSIVWKNQVCRRPTSFSGQFTTSSLCVMPASCISFTISFSLDENSVQYVADSMSLMRNSSSTESLMLRCTWETTRSFTSASISSFVSPPPAARSFVARR